MTKSENKLSQLSILIARAAAIHQHGKQLTISQADALPMLCVSFLGRSIEYATSVRNLVEVGDIASAALIARTMLEGAACAQWVLKSDDPKARAERWHKFSFNESLKTPDELEEGNPDSNAFAIKREAKRRQESGESFKQQRWTVDEKNREWKVRELIENMLESVPEAKTRVYFFYQQLSSLTHWGPTSFPVDLEKYRAGQWGEASFHEGFVYATVSTAFLCLQIVGKNVGLYLNFKP